MSKELKQWGGKTYYIVKDAPKNVKCEQMDCRQCPLKNLWHICKQISFKDYLIDAKPIIEDEILKWDNNHRKLSHALTSLNKPKHWHCEVKLFDGIRDWGTKESDTDLEFGDE